jgi:hypothetical protein
MIEIIETLSDFIGTTDQIQYYLILTIACFIFISIAAILRVFIQKSK